MYRLAFLLLIASAAIAQDSPLFPRVSVTGGRYGGRFTTDVRLDPDATGEGTRVGFDREFRFRNNVYPVHALVTTGFDLTYWSATYTYWARRSARDGFGITLGAAG